MSKSQHLPSIVGCAVGFCAAGSGVGSLVGMFVEAWLFPPLPEGQGTMHDQLVARYSGTLWGIVVGMGVGLMAGVLFAVLVRRFRLRCHDPVCRHYPDRIAPAGETAV